MAEDARRTGLNLSGAAKFFIAALVTGFVGLVLFVVLGFAVLGGGSLTTLMQSACLTDEGGGDGGSTFTDDGSQPSDEALSDIPEDFLKAYQDAGEKHGLDWAVIAAIGKQETNHGRHSAGCEASGAGAQGPMQFLPSTWASYGEDGNGDGTKDVCDIQDAAFGTANYIKDLGAPEDYRGAVCQYYGACADANANYADEVMAQAEEYRQAEEEQQAAEGVPAVALTMEPAKSLGRVSAPFASIPLPDVLASSPVADSGGGAPLASGTASFTAESLPSQVYDAVSSGAADTVSGAASGAADSLGPDEASAVEQGWSLVEGDQLGYENYSKYGSAVDQAAEDWNSLGGVSVSEGGSQMEIGDISSGEGVLGTTYSDGRILFNTTMMDQSTSNAQNAAATHEFGHALNMGHYNGGPSVMNTPITYNASNNSEDPTEYDIQQYEELYGDIEGGGGSPGGGDGDSVPVSDEGGGGSGGGDGGSGGVSFPVADEYAGNYEDTWGGASPGGSGNEITEIGGEEGAEVSSITAGEVVDPANAGSGGSGASVLVEVSEGAGPIQKGDYIYYTNLADPPAVEVGDTVEAGDKIGEMASGDDPSAGIGWYTEGDRAETGSGAMNAYDMLKWVESNEGSGGGGGGDGGQQKIACPEEDPSDGGDGGGGGPTASGEGPEAGKELVDAMMKYIGTPYEIGGLAPAQCNENVVDCDCHVYLGMRDIGEDAIADGHLNGVQGPAYYNTIQGEDITDQYGQDLQAGDIIVWEQAGPILGSVPGGHIAVATGNGKEIVHAIPPEAMVSEDYSTMYPADKVTVSRIVRPF